MNQNIDSYPIPAPTNGTLTPTAWILTHLSYARQQDLNPNPQDLIKSTLAETRLPATREPLPSGFYPRHFESAQRHIHWNDFKTEWIDCAAFFCTHFMDLPNMTAQEKEQEHSDCPEYFGDADMVVLQLGLCKECEGFHYEAASRGEGGSTTMEWGRAISMALVGNGVGMGLGQGQTHGQNQSGQEIHNQQPEVGGQHATENDGQMTPTVESRYSVVDGMLLRGRERRERMGQTHQSHSQPEMHVGGQQQHDDDDLDNDYDDDEDGQTPPTVESRYSVVDGFLRRMIFG
ncbi:hypothetical protein N0V85_005492 [Neurospora sp. IMI 360204]|nr:hypothetical protein N0V85_005492 [Neurospora sp. IMI 360204]